MLFVRVLCASAVRVGVCGVCVCLEDQQNTKRLILYKKKRLILREFGVSRTAAGCCLCGSPLPTAGCMYTVLYGGTPSRTRDPGPSSLCAGPLWVGPSPPVFPPMLTVSLADATRRSRSRSQRQHATRQPTPHDSSSSLPLSPPSPSPLSLSRSLSLSLSLWVNPIYITVCMGDRRGLG